MLFKAVQQSNIRSLAGSGTVSQAVVTALLSWDSSPLRSKMRGLKCVVFFTGPKWTIEGGSGKCVGCASSHSMYHKANMLGTRREKMRRLTGHVSEAKTYVGLHYGIPRGAHFGHEDRVDPTTSNLTLLSDFSELKGA